MQPIHVTSDTYIDYNSEHNYKDPKFKVGDHVSISKYKTIFAKGYTRSWSEEVSVIKTVKNTVPWTYIISVFNGEESAERFHEIEQPNISQTEFRTEKVFKRKGDRLYIKWKGYDNSVNS